MAAAIRTRRLVIKSFHVNKVAWGEKTHFANGVLTLKSGMEAGLRLDEELAKAVTVNLIAPWQHDCYVNSIMDIIPVSAKVLGRLGSGITHTFTGAYVLLTGATADGRQMAEFGSSEGILREKLMLGRAGTPSPSDWLIHVDVTLAAGRPFDRELPTTAHRIADRFVDSLRAILKGFDGRWADESHEYYDVQRPGKKKVVLVKLVAGQGAMYDNLLFPTEPSGYAGGRSIIDLGNVPVILTPNEYRDGALRAMT